MTPQKKDSRHTTTCRYCGQEIKHHTFGLPAAGETKPPQRLIEFVMALGTHVAEHSKETAELTDAVQDFSGLLIVNSFATDDPGLLARVEAIRADVHRRTGKHFITDDGIRTILERLGPEPTAEAVSAVLFGLRDAYEEKGEYAPPKAPEKVQLPH